MGKTPSLTLSLLVLALLPRPSAASNCTGSSCQDGGNTTMSGTGPNTSGRGGMTMPPPGSGSTGQGAPPKPGSGEYCSQFPFSKGCQGRSGSGSDSDGTPPNPRDCAVNPLSKGCQGNRPAGGGGDGSDPMTRPTPRPDGKGDSPHKPGGGDDGRVEYNADGSPKNPKKAESDVPAALGGGGSDLSRKANIALQLGDFGTACDTARQALQENPGDAKAQNVQSQACRRELSDPAGGAAAPAGKDVTFNDKMLNSKGALLRQDAGGGALGVSLAQRAEELQRWTQKLLEAREADDQRAVAEAAGKAAQLADDPADKSKLLAAKAMALGKLGDYKAALGAAEAATDLDPSNAEAWMAKAFALGGLGERDAMIEALKEAARLDPRYADALKKALAGDASDLFGGKKKKGKGVSTWVLAGAAGGTGLLGILFLLAAARKQQAAAKPAAATIKTTDAKTLVAQAPAIAVGSIVGENYRIVGELGRGGMGVVYDAVDQALQRRVAIKQLQRDASTTQADLERFLKEARLVAQLKHPNLAEIYAVVTAGDPLLVFEFVDGQTLDKLLAANKKIAPAHVRGALAELCAALDYAHAQNIIHRDLKPSNVMVTKTGALKIMDFGIAHQARGAAATRTAVSGTPAYMAPEQAMGSVSKAADFYALGVMTYEMLCGARPFEGPDFLEQKLQKQIVAVQRRDLSLPPSLDAFFAAALDPDPTKRPDSGARFLEAFHHACSAQTA